MASWIRAYRSISRVLTLQRLRLLPYVALLLLDAPATGLEGFSKLVRGPFGLLGVAVLVCRRAPRWLLASLAAAGATHARKTRGGAGWLWAFWPGFPGLLADWANVHWEVSQQAPQDEDLQTAVEALRPLLCPCGLRAMAVDEGTAQGDAAEQSLEMRRCKNCWDWTLQGSFWRGTFYCEPCSDGWHWARRKQNSWTESDAADASPNGPAASPMSFQMPVLAPAPAPLVAAAAVVEDSADKTSLSPRQPPAWRPVVDCVDFAEYEVRVARSRGCNGAPPKKNGVCGPPPASAPGAAAAAGPLARIVERCTGLSAAEAESSLSSMESLKVIVLVSALRRELGVDLAALDVAACSTLSELEQLCTRTAAAAGAGGTARADAAEAAESAGGANGSSQWVVFTIPRFWKAPVGWLIRLDEVPDEACMRAACRALVHRHAGLRAMPYATAGDEAMANLCNGTSPIVCTVRALLGGGGFGEGLCDRAAEGLIGAWPRILCRPACGGVSSGAPPMSNGAAGVSGPDEANFEWMCFSTEPDLRRAAWLRARSRGFRLPLSIAVLLLSPDGAAAADGNGTLQKEMAYLHIAVNHAVTDAASIVPMVADLLELHRAARKCKPSLAPEATADLAQQALAMPAAPGTCGELRESKPLAMAALESAALPPAPNGMAEQNKRLVAALLPSKHSGGACSGGGPPDADAALDLVHNAFNPRRRGHDHYIRLMPGATRVLDVAAETLGVPSDHLLVAALTVAFGEISRRDEVKLSLIAPMRDGRGDNRAVANLATIRHLSAWVGGGRSLLAVALELSGRLRRRDWSFCGVLVDDGDRFFINVRSIPGFEGAHPVMESVDTTRRPTRFVRNLVEMFADQETAESWAFWMGIREDLDGTAMAKALRRALWLFATDPLEAAIQAKEAAES